MKITVLGCGRWGSFIAWYLEKMGHRVCIWGRESSASLTALRQGKMGAFAFQETIQTTSDLEEAIAFGEIICISISAQALRTFVANKAFFAARQKPIILCMKGLEEKTGARLSEIVAEAQDGYQDNLAIWVGPGHVEDFLANIPNCMVIDAYDDTLKDKLICALKGDRIRFYYGTDMIGNEVGAASKNVIGIAAGMLDGLGLPSLKGALMARGAREISRLIHAMGGEEMSAYGLAHLGDYEATVFSKYSRNRAYGESFVSGAPIQGLAEGVSTSHAMMQLAKKYGVELPISEAVYDMIYHDISPDEIAERLFARGLKKEF